MIADLFRHGQHTAMIADQQPGHHNGNRTGKVQNIGKRKSTGYQGQGNQNFNLVVFHTFQHPIGDTSDEQPEEHAAKRFFKKKACYRGDGDGLGSGGNLQYDQKNHHRDTVVKQGFAGNFDFEACGYPGLF